VKSRCYWQPKGLIRTDRQSVWDDVASHQRQENAECAEERLEIARLVKCADDSVLQTTFIWGYSWRLYIRAKFMFYLNLAVLLLLGYDTENRTVTVHLG